jgi:hypothetical protein
VRIVQIVSSLAAGAGGVADCAWLLADTLGSRGIESRFVVTDGGEEIGNFSIEGLRERTGEAVAQTLVVIGAGTTLLHFVGYAYERRGLCGWLIDGLARWKAGDDRRRLLVMFHELWAFGPPWRSSFWTHPLQRRIAFRLAVLADGWVTSTELYARRLHRLGAGGKPSLVLPVPSNVGEPENLARLTERPTIAVVFGQRPLRRQVYQSWRKFMPLLIGAGIERIADIGDPLEEGAMALCSLPVQRHGFLPADAASEVLRTTRLGLLVYPIDFAAKSGVLAAYAAHGVLPVLSSPTPGAADGLVPGTNLCLIGTPGDKLVDRGDGIATAARRWYDGHDLATTSAKLADLLQSLR